MYVYVECIHTYIAALVERYHNGFVCRQLQATEMYKNLLSVQSMVYKFVYLGKFQPNSTHLYIITYAKVFSNMISERNINRNYPHHVYDDDDGQQAMSNYVCMYYVILWFPM